jgi:tryptophanyl-tRNA synthetase
MSKSYNNDIELAASPEETAQRVLSAFTDPSRQYRGDPGHPEICNIYHLHQLFNPGLAEEIHHQCPAAAIGCVDCKRRLAQEINTTLAPFRERRKELADKPDYVKEVLLDGARRASIIAKETIQEAKERMNLV